MQLTVALTDFNKQNKNLERGAPLCHQLPGIGENFGNCLSLEHLLKQKNTFSLKHLGLVI